MLRNKLINDLNKKMQNRKNLETERLWLKVAQKSDAAIVLALYNTPKFVQFVGDRNLRSVEDAEIYITEKFLPQLQNEGCGNYIVERKSDGKRIGLVGIYAREGLDVSDIGFSFLPEFEGNGYGFEAASKLMEAAFAVPSISKISAITVKENVASQKLIKKLGLKFLKLVRLPGDDEELLYYEIEKKGHSEER